MPTIERQIDALGGAAKGTGEYNAGYHDGYSRALDAAMEIARDADETIDELVDTLRQLLEGTPRHGLVQWAQDTSAFLTRISNRRAA